MSETTDDIRTTAGQTGAGAARVNTISSQRFGRYFVIALVAILLLLFLQLVAPFVEAIILAAIFSAISRPIYNVMLRVTRGRDSLAAMISVFILIVLVLIPILFLLAIIAEEAASVAAAIAPWIDAEIGMLQRAGLDTIPLPSWLEPYRGDLISRIGAAASAAGSYMASALGHISQGAVELFIGLFVMLYTTFYFFLQGPQLARTLMGYMPISEVQRQRILTIGLSVSRATIKGTLIIGVLQGGLCGLGFAVAGIPSAVFWAAMMAILSVVPGIGTSLVYVPAAAYLGFTGEYLSAILLLVWCGGVVGNLDNILRPRLIGQDTKMPDLLILLSTLGGIGVYGASGILIGPIIAGLLLTVLSIYSEVFADLLKVHGPPQENEAGAVFR